MKIIKWVLGLAVLLVAVVVIAGTVILSSTDLDEIRVLVQDQAREATGRELVLAGPMDLGISLTPSIRVEQVRFANAAWGSRPDMVALDRFELQLGLLPLLSGDVQIDRVVLVGADILLEKDKDGNVNWSFGEAEEAQAGEAGDLPTIGSVVIESSKVTYKDGGTGETIELAIERTELAPAGGNLGVDLEGSYQDVAFALAGEIGGLASFGSAEPFPIRLKGRIAGAEITLDGAIADLGEAPKPDLAFSVAGDDVAAFAPLAGTELPKMGPYSLAGRLTGEATAFSIAGLAAKMGGSDLAGDVTIEVGGERPKVVATLTSSLLSLADFGAQADGGTEPAPADDSPYVIPETPLPLDALRGLDAEITASVAKLVAAPGVEVVDLEATLVLAGGRLALDPFRASYAGGVASAALALDAAAATPTMDLAATVDDLDFGRVLAEQGVSDEVKGTMDVTLDLEGAGASPHAIASTLDGTTEVIAEKGVLTNKLLAVVASGLGEILGPLFGGKDDTALNCVLSRFTIENGVATSQALLVDTSTFSLAGSGTIDLRDESLDMHMDTSSRQAALVSLAVPFNVTGTLKNPQVTPDPLGAAAAAAKLAGTAINPMAALGVMVAAGGMSGGGAADCVQAEQKAAESGGTGIPVVDQATETIEKAVEGVTGGAGEAVEGVTEGLKSLFGD
ncbi:MAG: AsmA family protein [Alphaproteobacteria bacterium]